MKPAQPEQRSGFPLVNRVIRPDLSQTGAPWRPVDYEIKDLFQVWDKRLTTLFTYDRRLRHCCSRANRHLPYTMGFGPWPRLWSWFVYTLQRSKEGVRQKRRSYREPDDDEDAIGEDLAAVNERLDALTRQLERMAHANAAPRAGAGGTDERADRVSDALARLDRRLDQVIHEAGATATNSSIAPNTHRRLPRRQPPLPLLPPTGRRSAQPRSRQLGGADFRAPARARWRAPPRPCDAAASPGDWGGGRTSAAWSSSSTTSTRRFRRCISPTSTRSARCAAISPRSARALTDAMPRRAIEALETEVRALAERVDRTRQAGADGAALGSLERELAEVRNALRSLTPAESLAGFEEAVRGLRTRSTRSPPPARRRRAIRWRSSSSSRPWCRCAACLQRRLGRRAGAACRRGARAWRPVRARHRRQQHRGARPSSKPGSRR